MILKDIYDNFIKFHKNIDLSNGNEVELIFIKPHISLASTLYNYEPRICKTYIEFIIKYENKNKKLRKRIPFNRNNFDINNITLYNGLDDNWEKKTLITEDIIIPNEVICKFSKEKPKKIAPNILYSDAVSMYYVSLICIKIENVVVDFKFKIFLGKATDNNTVLLSILNSVPNIRKQTQYTLEFELTDKTDIKHMEIAMKYVFKIMDLGNLELLFSSVRENVKTFMIPLNELHLIPTQDYLITGKIDGISIIFEISDNICTLIKYNFKYTLSCNICNHNLKGMGELIKIDNINYIYPFSFEYIDTVNIANGFDRKYMLDLYNDIISSNDNTDNNCKLKFVKKQYYGPYKSVSDIIDHSTYFFQNPLYDGVILLDTKKNTNYTDYKIKLDNTIDVPCKLEYTNGIYIKTKKGTAIEFILYNYDGKKFNLFERSIELSQDNKLKFRFDNNLNLLVCNVNSEWIVLPPCFICEYSMVKKEIIIPRLHKTHLFYKYNYNGNPLHIVIKSKEFHDKYATISIDNISAIVDISDKQPKNTSYFLPKTVRTVLNIVSNLVKTNMITMSGSSLFTNIKKKNVLIIDIGRGGDLNKYYYIGTSNMVGTDPDKSALDEASSRYSTTILNFKKKSNVYTLSLHNISIHNDNYVNIVTGNTNNKFWIIDWQFAIHYSYNANTKHDILSKLKKISMTGTRILITCLDGHKVLNLINTTTSKTLNFIIPHDKTQYNYTINYVSPTKISVFYDATMTAPMEENLIFLDELEIDFKKYGFKLIDTFNFDDIISSNKLYTFEVLARSLRSSTAKFHRQIFENKESIFNTDFKKLLSVNMGMIFMKVDHI